MLLEKGMDIRNEAKVGMELEREVIIPVSM